MHGKVNRNNMDNLFFWKKRENKGRCSLSTVLPSAQQNTHYTTMCWQVTKQRSPIAQRISQGTATAYRGKDNDLQQRKQATLQ